MKEQELLIYTRVLKSFIDIDEDAKSSIINVLASIEDFNIEGGTLEIEATVKPEYQHLSWKELQDTIQHTVNNEIANLIH